MYSHTLLSAYYSFQIWLLETKVIIPEFYDSITKIYLSISCFPKKTVTGLSQIVVHPKAILLFYFFQESQFSLLCCKLTRHRNCLKAFVAGIQLLSIHCAVTVAYMTRLNPTELSIKSFTINIWEALYHK